MLTHKGRIADAGHYVAWIKRGPDDWLCFDDEKVHSVKDDDIKQLGGRGGGTGNHRSIVLEVCL